MENSCERSETSEEDDNSSTQTSEICSLREDNAIDGSDSDTDISSYSLLCEHVTETDMYDMEEQIKRCIDDYVQHTILALSSPTYYSDLDKEVAGTLFEEWITAGICEEHHYDDILEIVNTLRVEYFEMNEMPLREENTNSDVSTPKIDILSSLTKLQNIYQAKQRTPEWYETRYNLLTASNLWKVFGSQAQYNSLIYEKCKPLEIRDYSNASVPMDITNSLQHGILYEPLSALYYEYVNNTKITDVGCIPHEKYSYIGASPDGIIMDTSSSLYGRMIEIKNIVNREITGVPLEAYWIQMQLQMEVCDLEECDFVETRFIHHDELPSINDDGKPSGIILYFFPKIAIGEFATDITSEYAYMPISISPASIEADIWIQEQSKQRPRHVLYKKTYWVLDQYSCVLVRRNRPWFQSALPKIQEVWNTILMERESGYEHRSTNSGASKKKKEHAEVVCTDNNTTHYIRNMPITNSICLIKLGGGGTKVPPDPSLWGNQGSPRPPP